MVLLKAPEGNPPLLTFFIAVGIFGISHETLLRTGASEDSVKLPPERGGGYMAMLEVHHQIHCVVSRRFITALHPSTKQDIN